MIRSISTSLVALGTLALGLIATGWPTSVSAYPLDGTDRTGIMRLEGYRLVQKGKMPGRLIPPGGRHGTDSVYLRLAGRRGNVIPAPDPQLSRMIANLAGYDANNYGIALLDLTNPDRPVYAEHNATMALNPGSVGKILVALGIFQTLKDIYPNDEAARSRILKNTMITADIFSQKDSHDVPFWKPGSPKVYQRKLKVGTRANFWTYMDWMLSSSANAAAGMLQKNLIMMQAMGRAYPPSPAQEKAFYKNTKRGKLGALLAKGMQDPVTRNGLNLKKLRQGSFFTRQGKYRVPGTNSIGTSRELMKFLVKMEQGRLVDYYSSLEMKRLLYLSERRIRYASAPALYSSAVYYKSGSLYSCKPEKGFVCKKYHGNVVNNLNSIITVETPSKPKPMFYMVTLTSNVLRKNSAVVHQTLATRIHRLLERRHGVKSPR